MHKFVENPSQRMKLLEQTQETTPTILSYSLKNKDFTSNKYSDITQT